MCCVDWAVVYIRNQFDQGYLDRVQQCRPDDPDVTYSCRCRSFAAEIEENVCRWNEFVANNQTLPIVSNLYFLIERATQGQKWANYL